MQESVVDVLCFWSGIYDDRRAYVSDYRIVDRNRGWDLLSAIFEME